MIPIFDDFSNLWGCKKNSLVKWTERQITIVNHYYKEYLPFTVKWNCALDWPAYAGWLEPR